MAANKVQEIEQDSRSATSESKQVKHSQMKRRLDKLAWVLDSSIPLPGGYSLGVDSLVGLIPGVGDAIAVLFSTYIVGSGVRAGAPKSILARMVGNVAIEAAIGAIPLVGDWFDIVFKSNVRNVKLLEDYLDQPEQTHRVSKWVIVGVFIAVIAIVGGSLLLSILFFGWLLTLIF